MPRHDRSAADAGTTVQKNGSPPNIFKDGVDNRVELTDRNRRTVGNWNVHVVDAGIASEHGLLVQRDHGRDGMRISANKILSVISSAYEQPLPDLCHPCSSILYPHDSETHCQ
jgi:hypothetical protein